MKSLIYKINEVKHSFKIGHLKREENSLPDLTNFDEQNPLKYQGVKISLETRRATSVFNQLKINKREEIIKLICDIIDEIHDDKMYFIIYNSGSGTIIKVGHRNNATLMGWIEFFSDPVIKKGKGCCWLFDSYDFTIQIKDNLKETVQYIKSKIK